MTFWRPCAFSKGHWRGALFQWIQLCIRCKQDQRWPSTGSDQYSRHAIVYPNLNGQCTLKLISFWTLTPVQYKSWPVFYMTDSWATSNRGDYQNGQVYYAYILFSMHLKRNAAHNTSLWFQCRIPQLRSSALFTYNFPNTNYSSNTI